MIETNDDTGGKNVMNILQCNEIKRYRTIL